MIESFIYELKQSGISVWQQEDKLKIASNVNLQGQAIVEQLKQNKPQLLRYLTRQGIDSKARFDELSILPLETRCAPLTLGQQQLLFTQEVSNAASTYHIPCLLKIAKHCDIEKLTAAIEQLVIRHSALDMVVAYDHQGKTIQQPANEAFVVTHHELGNLNLHEQCEHFFNEPFSLQHSRPFRAYVITSKEQQHVFFVWHHIAFDGWSLGLFLQELTSLYEGENRPLSLQFSDYAYYMATPGQRERQATSQRYWQTQLADYEPLKLAQTQSRPATFDHRGAIQSIVLDESTTLKLQQTAKTHRISINTLGLAAWYHTLALLSHQRQFVVGIPSENRPTALQQNILGYFVNSLPIKADIDMTMLLERWFTQVNQVVNQAKQHQALPFEAIKNSLDVPLDTSMHPIFQTLFSSSQFAPEQHHTLWQSVDLDLSQQCQAKFDLTLHLSAGKTTELGLTYASALFSSSYAQQILELYQTVLQAYLTAENAQQPLYSLPLLSNTAQQKQYQLSGMQHAYPSVASITDQFAEIVARYPNKAAISNRHQTLSYQELDNQAKQLANAILAVCPEPKVVALYMRNDIEFVIAMLAVLKTGAAYTTLSLKDPVARHQYQLSDSNADVIVTLREHSQTLATLNHNNIAEVFCDTSLADTDITVDFEPMCIAPSEVATIIYTSGTTGNPKGTLLSHAAISSLALDNHSYQHQPQDSFIQLANPAFDATLFEIWSALLNGAEVNLGYQDSLNSAAQLSATLQTLNITSMFLTRSLFDTLLLQDEHIFASLTHLLVGGEALTESMVNKLLASTSCPKHFINGYGPTECTTFTTVQTMSKQQSEIAIGKPIPGRAVAVVGRNNELLPLGCPGELVVCGHGVAARYLNNPTLNSEKFVSLNLFGSMQKYYRTGDLVYWNAQQQLCYINRGDQQVKVRGFRIELAEIEHHLNQLADIDSCAVIAKKQQAQTLLHAYLVIKPAADQAAALSHCKTQLTKLLPSYMMPHSFTVLSALPLTLNGKLDKTKLPEPELKQHQLVVPQTNTEKEVQAIWQDVLGQSPLCCATAVTEQGADSISLLSFCGAASKRNWQLTPQLILEHLSVQQLARFIDNQTRLDFATMSETQAIDAALAHEHFAPSRFFNAPQSEFLLHLMPAAATADSFAPLCEKLAPDLRIHALENIKLFTGKHISLHTMVRYYAQRITEVSPTGPLYLGGFCEGAALSLEVARYLAEMGREIVHCFLIDPVLPRLTSAARQAAEEEYIRSQDDDAKPIARAFLDFTQYFQSATAFTFPVSFFIADHVSDEAIPLPALKLIHQVEDIPALYKRTFASDRNGFENLLANADYITLESAHDEIMTDAKDLSIIASHINALMQQTNSAATTVEQRA
ncbi:non-ribosomal peptide synthetase [Pseudoalteromonas maricaloris]|uniref:Amino acid adenylation domain-containing protein n=2 Tax=Pseudoalteromonas TaxID=53246 RepID=A0A8I2KSH8_9GAMM|nr:non-ribosomal peptide synthetase [Pseudoalteromonas maricaloris]NLR24128.1 amino acid adenylation domain-containing protein [Pseudoalteromonas maricaloris]WOX28472.1 non-ribosomal peptide synthetase [Pseudoalteromonas maricaloris]